MSGSLESPTPAPLVRDLLLNSYETFAESPAVADPSSSLTFAQLQDAATAVACGLALMGCKPGDRVVLIAPNSTEWVVVDHACHLGGFTRVALMTRLHPSELADIVRDADPRVVIVDRDWLQSAGRTWLPPGLSRLIVLGGDDRSDPSLASVAASGAGLPLSDTQSDIAWLLYTSGSTGRPKGVVCSGRGVGAMVRNIVCELPDLNSDERALHTAPLGHFSGAVALAVTVRGGQNTVLPSFVPTHLLDEVRAGTVTLLPLVPTQITMLTDEAARQNFHTAAGGSSLRTIVYAGSAIAPTQLTRALDVFGPVFTQFYGASESPMPLTALGPSQHTMQEINGRLRLSSAGRPNRNVGVCITGESGELLGPGEVGEVKVRGEQTMVSYWRQPEATSEVLGVDGWLKTGDLGTFDEDGFLYIVDRKKDMIVSGGFNVYPREVENVLATMPELREVAVVGAPSHLWGEEVTAVVSLQPGSTVDLGAVADHCRASLAGYKVPRRLIIRGELPKSGAGKLLKRALRDELWTDRERQI